MLNIRTTRTQRLRAEATRKRIQAAENTAKPRPDSIVTFVCLYEISHSVLILLSAGDIGRLEMCSKHFHHKRIGKENLTLPLPLRTNIVWRQLWIDTPLRRHIENDKSWLKSSWGKRIQQPTAKANTSTKQHPKRKQKQSRATSQPASKPTVQPQFPLHFEDSKITWRNTFRAASISWSRRRSGKMFARLRKLQKSGAVSQSLQRTISSCKLTSFEILINGKPAALLKSTKGHERLWSSEANRIGSTLSSDGARYFSSSIAVKVDWAPESTVSSLQDLETIELWTESRTLKRKRKLFSMRLKLNDSVFLNWNKYLILEQGDFRLYQVPENVFVSNSTAKIVDVNSSIVFGTWGYQGNGNGSNRSSNVGNETIAFCMVHVHLQHAMERLLSPLPKAMAMTKQPFPDDLMGNKSGTCGYTVVLGIRSFARCCWETKKSNFDLINERNDSNQNDNQLLRGCLLENGQISWDTSLHFGLEPSLLCRTPCFSTTVDNACVVECTIYDEFGNVVLGSVDVIRILSLDVLLEARRNNNNNNNTFWERVRHESSFGSTIDLESRCGFEIQSKVGLIQIALCRVVADQSGETVLAVERVEVGVRNDWRKNWFG